MRIFWLLIIIMIAVAGCSGKDTPSEAVPTTAATIETALDNESIADSLIEATATPICAVQASEFIDSTDAIFEKWDDAYSLASSTPRSDLSGSIATLQGIKREAGNLDVPECARDVKDSLLALMEFAIDGFLSFLANEKKPFEELDFILATAVQERFNKTFAELVTGVESEGIDLTYVALASSLRKFIEWVDINGRLIGENAPSRWSKNFIVPPGFLARIEIPAGTGEYVCAILFDWQVADLKFSNPNEDMICEGNAPSN